MFRPLLRLILLLCLPLLRAAEPGAEISGDVLDTSLGAGGDRVYRGNAVFRSGNLLVTADELRYVGSTETVVATGRVTFTRGETRLLAERLEYRRSDGWFSASNIRLGLPPYFAEAASAEGSREEITLRKARVSYGEPGPWQPTVTADVITLAPGKSLRTERAAAGIGQAQPITLPRLDHNIAQPLPITAELDAGFRRSLGAFADALLLLPLSKELRVGGDVGLYTRRGLMAGPAARYESADDGETWRGNLRSGFIRDHGDRRSDVLGRPIPIDRGYAEWSHRQRLTPDLTLNAQWNWWKDSDVLRDFRPDAYFPVQEPDSFIEAVHRGTDAITSLFLRVQPNDFHAVQRRLPELRFDLLPRAAGEGFYHTFSASLAVLREHPVAGGPVLGSDRLDAVYEIMRPVTPNDWFAFTPVAGGRYTHYLNPPGGARTAGSHTRWMGEAGFDAALRLSAVFDVKSPRWRVDGLRHLLTPRLGYRYLPASGAESPVIPRIDRESFSTYLPPLGLGAARHVDDLRAANTFRLSIDNTLQTRDPALGSRDLLIANLAADFRLRRRAGERDVSEIHAEAIAQPAEWLQADIYQSFAPQTRRLREFNTGLTLRDGREWSARLGSNFLRGQLQDYTLHARRRIDERLSALLRLQYDSRRQRFNEQTYGVAQTLANTWIVTYSVSVFSGRRRESDFGFDVRVDAVRF
ncbi:MAG: LPS assembly protein LptD [Opitutaceae bacterium]